LKSPLAPLYKKGGRRLREFYKRGKSLREFSKEGQIQALQKEIEGVFQRGRKMDRCFKRRTTIPCVSQ